MFLCNTNFDTINNVKGVSTPENKLKKHQTAFQFTETKSLVLGAPIDNILHLDMKLIMCTHAFNRILVVSL